MRTTLTLVAVLCASCTGGPALVDAGPSGDTDDAGNVVDAGDAGEGEGNGGEGEGNKGEGEGEGAGEGEGETNCHDLLDEDGDLRYDCHDPDCQATADCTPGTGVTGAACTHNSDCFADENDPACLDEVNFAFPSGYCSEWCNLSDGHCSGDGVCFAVGVPTVGLCFDQCSTDTDCRTDYFCSPTLGVCVPHSSCGDGIVQYPEECEPGNLRGRKCVDLGFAEGDLGCFPPGTEGLIECQFDTSGCHDVCGDGVIGSTEQCDGADLFGATCEDFCLASGTLACDATTCALDFTACVQPTCGNDVVEGCEPCDGTDLAGTSCTDFGFGGGVLACASDCSDFDTSPCFDTCGDAQIGPTEECDDGNLDPNDDCDASCHITACQTADVVGGDGTFTGDTSAGSAFLGAAGCQFDVGGGVPFAFHVPSAGVLRVTVHAATDHDVDIRQTCADVQSELQCSAGSAGVDASIAQVFVDVADVTIVVMPAHASDAGPFSIDVAFEAAVCGDGVAVSPLEPCDGNDLSTNTCEGLGFTGGALGCAADCTLDVAHCASTNTCDHDVCVEGTALDASVCGDACVDAVCDANDACCLFGWTSDCVASVATLCTTTHAACN